ncbi:hypothetical protein CEXT_161621 [Caerostris extrusa]|uniref:Uncharacterized protein n=1 Tax=Caerostris extrusa TaxID=172846 RepID=A0AAV4MP42_CAEEX|nr:hypothetical protein CEXT_161621 [Caerostris extrusa]
MIVIHATSILHGHCGPGAVDFDYRWMKSLSVAIRFYSYSLPFNKLLRWLIFRILACNYLFKWRYNVMIADLVLETIMSDVLHGTLLHVE